ncbi:MAG TPA: uroporphyrinogen decarboxylase family protein [Planctomycetota bacterium]|nr:uroporphyrinogen decarboxylase family protein [Planctomycetota bacterium]
MSTSRGLLDILRGRAVGRAAVVCPGGMMSLAVTEVMTAADAAWPDAHRDAGTMLRLALAMHDAIGFDNVAMPFCMTVEAEAYGAPVDLGSVAVHPRVTGAILGTDGTDALPRPDFRAGRARTLLDALGTAKDHRPDLPLIGNLVGPFSLLGMLADPLRVLRWTRRRPQALQTYLDRITDDLIEFGRLQTEAGADVLSVAEPTATGEILGGTLFREHVLPHLDRLVRTLHAEGPGTIVHICGNVRPIEAELLELTADAVSFDSMVDVVALVRKTPPWRVMGNLDAFLLESGPIEAIRRRCRRLLAGGIGLLAPACSVIPVTPVAHLRVMREVTETFVDGGRQESQ